MRYQISSMKKSMILKIPTIFSYFKMKKLLNNCLEKKTQILKIILRIKIIKVKNLIPLHKTQIYIKIIKHCRQILIVFNKKSMNLALKITM